MANSPLFLSVTLPDHLIGVLRQVAKETGQTEDALATDALRFALETYRRRSFQATKPGAAGLFTRLTEILETSKELDAAAHNEILMLSQVTSRVRALAGVILADRAKSGALLAEDTEGETAGESSSAQERRSIE